MTDERPHHILVVDDEYFIRDALQIYFESNGFRVTTAESEETALVAFKNMTDPVDVVILDLVMPGTHGLQLLKIFKKLNPRVAVIIATGCGSLNNAVEALRFGAFDYVTKPIVDFDEDLLKTVRKALTRANAPEQTAGSASAPAPKRAELRSWLPVYERMNRFASEFPDALTQQASDEMWSILSDGFCADAALLIRKGKLDDWDCVLTWGFASPPGPRDLWQTPRAEARSSASVNSAAQGGAEGSVPPSKWANVVQMPLDCGTNGEFVLLLFYREPSLVGHDTSPLPVLSAVLSHVLRRPNCFEGLPTESVAGSIAGQLGLNETLASLASP